MNKGKKKYVLAIDIGTTSVKTLIIDFAGRVHASHSIDYALSTPYPDCAEQDPDEIFDAVLSSVRKVIDKSSIEAEELLCASFSSAMHSLIALDEQERRLTECIIWADNRSRKQAERLKQDSQGQSIYMATGTPIHPMSPLPKLMWMREEEPDKFAQAHMFLGIKEYVFFRLFGRYVMDHSIASATGLFHLQNRDWDEAALKVAGIKRQQLPELMPTTGKLIGMKPELAQKMGISDQLPIVLGASDGVLANLGVGAVASGQVAVTIGTSGAVRVCVKEPLTDPKQRLFCYALTEDQWVIGGAINNGGIMLRWVRDELATLEAQQAMQRGQDPYDYLAQIASQVKAGSDGLLFLPLLAGERAPYWNANARGVFFGLSLAHKKQHMVRAVMEGVMLRILSVVDALREVAGIENEIRASGGFARSSFWCEMMAHVIGSPVGIPDTIESSGLGAAKLGLLAMGEVSSLQELEHWNRMRSQYTPDQDTHDIYKELSRIYMNVYHHLCSDFDDIANFQSKNKGGQI